MSYYKDPTAWQAIANVERERKRKPPPKLKKYSGVKIYKEPKRTGGKIIHINKSEWFYSQMIRQIKGITNEN